LLFLFYFMTEKWICITFKLNLLLDWNCIYVYIYSELFIIIKTKELKNHKVYFFKDRIKRFEY
jgi:hypothetical protein